MKRNTLLSAEERWPRCHAVLAFLTFCFFMVCPAAPERWADLYSFYGKTLVVAVVVLAFFVKRFGFTVEVKLAALYALWLLISRMLNSDMYMVRESDLVLSKFLCAALLSTGLVLDNEQRRKFMNFFCAAIGLFYFCAGALAILADLLDTQFFLPPENVLFGLDGPWHIHYINPFNTNRTISSLWFYIALCLMVYQFFSCKHKLWRIPIIVAMLLFYVSIALCFSRTVKGITSNVASVLKLGAKGQLKAGFDADICLLAEDSLELKILLCMSGVSVRLQMQVLPLLYWLMALNAVFSRWIPMK